MTAKLAEPGTEDKAAAPMELALAEAEAARDRGEVPIGAVVVSSEGEVLARAGNRTLELRDPTAHAELLAIREACARLSSERLVDCDLYVTLEPCAMCAGAIVLARVDHLVFGAADPKTGACGSLRDVVRDPRLNHRVTLHEPRFGEACGQLLTEFFRARRGKGKTHG